MKTYTNEHAYKQLLSKDFNIEKCCISNLLSLPDKYVTKNICVHIYIMTNIFIIMAIYLLMYKCINYHVPAYKMGG